MQFGEWSAAEMSNYTKVAFHVFKGSGSDKWNCLLSCFFSGVASRCHPVICSLNERKLDALQLTRFNVYFHVQCSIKMRIDFVYRVTCKQKKKQQKMNHSIWEARLSHWLIYCIIIGVKRWNHVGFYLTVYIKQRRTQNLFWTAELKFVWCQFFPSEYVLIANGAFLCDNRSWQYILSAHHLCCVKWKFFKYI